MSSEGFEPPSNPTQTDHDTRLHYELIKDCFKRIVPQIQLENLNQKV